MTPAGFSEARALAVLRRGLDAAIAAADPMRTLAAHLPERPKGRIVVVGGGKAAARMAAAVEAAWPDAAGAVVALHGQGRGGRIRVLEGRHPVPDAGSAAAARQMLSLVEGLTRDDLVLALVSGGASSLLSLPAPGVTAEEKQALHRALLTSGATIREMNIVRKHLSAIKGGRLAAAAAPARVVTLLISDVPGDDPGTIASGPTVPDPSTWAEVEEIAARYGLDLPAVPRLETPKPGSLDADCRMIASPAIALKAAAEAFRAEGLATLVLGDAIEGESRELGTVLAGMARSVRQYGQPAAAPCILLSGGETTVTIGRGPAGRGGRNTELLLSLALGLQGLPDCWAIAADTDGIDGTEDAAGAVIGPGTLARARTLGLDARGTLAGHDSYGFFQALGDLLVTGPTGTNVNDFRAVLVA